MWISSTQLEPLKPRASSRAVLTQQLLYSLVSIINTQDNDLWTPRFWKTLAQAANSWEMMGIETERYNDRQTNLMHIQFNRTHINRRFYSNLQIICLMKPAFFYFHRDNQFISQHMTRAIKLYEHSPHACITDIACKDAMTAMTQQASHHANNIRPKQLCQDDSAACQHCQHHTREQRRRAAHWKVLATCHYSQV